MNKSGLNTYWSKKIVDLLYNKGVRHACISPGSRNAPLVKAFTDYSKIKCFSHFDERANAFFGLGIAKKSLNPVVLLTTSGTATANLFPAIIEGSMTMAPLIIITADRPRNLMNSGENQTINQINIYGNYVRRMEDFDKKKSITMLKKIDSMINISLGKNNSPGPIHLNIRFDEPLIDSNKIQTTYIPKKIKSIRKNTSLSIKKFKRPIIVCGGLSDSKSSEIIKLSKKLNCVIFADSLSNLRHYNYNNILVYYDHYIDKLTKYPDCIIRFGKKPISKKLTNLINKLKKSTYLIDSHLFFNDDCSNIIKSSINNVNINISDNIDLKWNKELINIENKVQNEIKKINFTNKSETSLIRIIKNKLNKNDHLFIGNSMPIRIFDQFSGKLKQPLQIFSNRGASGIDGIISTALGVSYLNKHSNNFLIIGDVSLFHDTNAFHILNNDKINLTIIAINNNGGQIFSRLSYSNKKIKDFEKFWITPPKTKIYDLAKLFKLKYYYLDNNQIDEKLNFISSTKGVKLIEVKVNSKKDIKIIEKLNQKLN